MINPKYIASDKILHLDKQSYKYQNTKIPQ